MTGPSRLASYAVAVALAGCSAAAGAALHSTFGYRFPLITFYPTIMLSAWFGGFWPGVFVTLVSAGLVDFLWLAPLRTAHLAVPGDPVALGLFLCIGLTVSAASESMRRSTAREHAARERAELGEQALQESERHLRLALGRERAARADAEMANRLKDQFVAVVSHELRTPLNALLGWTSMLKRNVLDDRHRDRALEAIYANATRQAQIVDDLLDVAGMMSGKLQLRRTPVNVGDIVRAVLEIVQPAAEVKGIALVIDSEAQIASISGDGIRLQQIFWNLLSNAIKFTPDNGQVHVRVHEIDDTIEVVVTDTGQGVPTEHLRSIFEPFYQADSSMTRVHSGLGLGLSIVKRLVEAHAGNVIAESAGKGRGSTFTVRLPTAAPYVQNLPSQPC